MINFIYDFVNLFFPNLCSGCLSSLQKGEEYICMSCVNRLWVTNYYLEKDNPVARLFWGRVDVENATSFCFFNKGEILQKLIHRLKYKGDKMIGYQLGVLCAAQLKMTKEYHYVDYIVPVPLHPDKLYKRGYNQAEWIALGMASVLNRKVKLKLLEKIKNNESQTKKTKEERIANVKNVYRVNKKEKIKDSHILLVDDVLTTGATLEACVNELKKNNQLKVSIATIAYANV